MKKSLLIAVCSSMLCVFSSCSLEPTILLHEDQVDLGLSCYWGRSNFNPYATDSLECICGGGRRYNYYDAIKEFGADKDWHLPTAEQFKELLNRCDWKFIDNPQHDYKMGYLVTGPNGNTLFFPCEDGEDHAFSNDWYLGLDENDVYRSCRMHLNAQSRLLSSEDKQLFGLIRLVKEK